MPSLCRFAAPAAAAILLIAALTRSDTAPAAPAAAPDLEAAAKKLTEAAGGQWRAILNPPNGFDMVSGSGGYQVLPFPLDRPGRVRLAGWADMCNARLVVVGHNRQWTVTGWADALGPEGAERSAKVLRALGIESREPEVVNGLSVMVSADKGWAEPTGKSPQGGLGRPGGLPPSLEMPEYAPGEPVVIKVEFRNATDAPIRLASALQLTNSGALAPAERGKPAPMGLTIDGARADVWTEEIVVPAKGAARVWVVTTPPGRHGLHPMIDPLVAETRLAAGDHSLRLGLTCDAKAAADAGAGFWSGTLRSNEVCFTVR